MRGRLLLACSFVLVVLVGFMAWSTDPVWSAKPESAEVKAFSRPEMHVTVANVPLKEVHSLLPNARQIEEFLQGQDPRTTVFVDPRSGIPSGIQMREPFIPGDGMGNHLGLEDLGRTLGGKVSEVTPEVVEKLLNRFVAKNHEALNVNLSQVGPAHAVKITDDLWHISAPQVVQGVPVRYARLVATLNHGNLVLFGAEMWGNSRVDTHPSLSASQALAAGFDHVGGRKSEDVIWKEPALEILPIAPQGRELPTAPGRRPGDGYDHWLVWSFGFSRGEDPARWQVEVDAHSGEVVGIADINYDAIRKITGNVFPMTNTEVCPSPDRCGTVQSAPMSFADYFNQNSFSNSAGLFDFTGNATSTLRSPYIRVTDGCGTISENSTGDIALGGFSGNHTCSVPGGHSTGDTSAARTAAYELNKLAEIARGWLPNNAWLQGQNGPQQVQTNRDTIIQPSPFLCQAFFDPSDGTVNTGKGGSFIDTSCCQDPDCQICGQCGATNCCPQCKTFECRNPGEIATILDHEWGHALDFNDGSPLYTPPGTTGNPRMSTPSEAYADITAALRTQTSCSGYGFKTAFSGDSEGCTLTSDGTGYNGNLASPGKPIHCLLECSGKRDLDYLKHVDQTPDTPQNFVCSGCGTAANGRPGPCGLEEHCEGAPIDQAAWDFAARDLQAGPFNYSKTKAFNVASKTHFQGSSFVQIWHTCSCAAGTSDGCGAGSGYLSWFAADDDNGNPFDGSPHMTALYAAFNRHNIACSSPTVQNSGCAGAPTTAPTLSATPGTNQVALSWTPDFAASKYFVYRTEGQAGCDMGRAVIGTPTTNSFTDTGVTDGRFYYYTVESVGTSDACSGPTSSCICATNPPSGIAEVCNGIDDNCNGQVDEGFDVDGDGYTTCGGDCNDNNPSVNPGQYEICDGLDNDCNGSVPPDEVDADVDGYRLCQNDCNDAIASIHPGATETCNNLDDNCNGLVDEGFDADFDGCTVCALPTADCNDNDARINCIENSTVNTSCFDQLDNDCDGVVDWDCSINVGTAANEVVQYGSVSPAQPAGLANMSASSVNNVYETISEVNVGGGQGRRLSVYWTFANPNLNNWWALRVEGFRATAGDSYTFSVAQRTQTGACGPSTGETYTTAFTVSKTTDDNLLQVYQIGPPNPGTLAFCVRVVDTIMSPDNSTDTLKLDKLYLMPILLDAKANSEPLPLIGTRLNGTSWLQTLSVDGVYEILQESTGDVLDNTWKFPSVPVGYSHTLHFEGFRTNNSDNFQFYYATPSLQDPNQPGTFQPISGAIVNTSVGGQISDWTFGPQSTTAPLYGTVWIKVLDTVPNSPTQDKLEVDYLAIRATP